MRQAEAVHQQQRGRGPYAEDGSLAQERRREEREKAMISHVAGSKGTDHR